MGFTVLAIADRMGHESIDITYRYVHLFPSEQTQMAEQLDGKIKWRKIWTVKEDGETKS